ncbi:acyl-CoA dehydrogenase family protein [Promicromonospora citrea]|uniref:Glutaryl-CoA dehydrogenase n=1 Tax=Promicromonospora citrea TaxID=43677 RepID=A0A8H9GKI0_9MICO|nr:acyl-CoA dehydrogenase family protein [Promicromonospora citrea]NNH53250.1 acyl-CoA dehydrogenase [Promicromonospora citrea]GGM34872.1 glutaryl-CoA dehydrogenase [Promicromonospora citrea]
MTLAPEPPATDLLEADFYAFQDLLTPAEQKKALAVREFMEREVRPIADDYWERAECPVHLFKPFAQLGTIGAGWAETQGEETSAVFRGWVGMEMARVDSSFCTFIGVSGGLAMTSIGVGGSAEQRATWLPPMANGDLIGAFGLTEPLAGSDTAKGLRTTATRTGDTWVLDGAKRWIGNATFADVVVIWAKDTADDQVKGFLVRKGTPGFTPTKIERKQSLRIVQNADIVLDGVEVHEADRLQGINSFRDLATVLRITRDGVSWQALGTMVGAYEAAVAYTKQREQFGNPIASYQLVQDKLATAYANVTAGFAMCVRVAQLQDKGLQADAHAAMAKAFVTTRMRETVALCREACGGNGITLDHGVARYFADAEAVYTFEGTKDMNQLIVGRAITGHAAFV